MSEALLGAAVSLEAGRMPHQGAEAQSALLLDPPTVSPLGVTRLVSHQAAAQ